MELSRARMNGFRLWGRTTRSELMKPVSLTPWLKADDDLFGRFGARKYSMITQTFKMMWGICKVMEDSYMLMQFYFYLKVENTFVSVDISCHRH